MSDHPFQAQPGCNICVCGLPSGEHEALNPQAIADLLRDADWALSHAATSLVAFCDRKYITAVERDFERCRTARKEIAAMLTHLPPARPMSPAVEAAVGRLIGAALHKRFGDGDQASIAAAFAEWQEADRDA